MQGDMLLVQTPEQFVACDLTANVSVKAGVKGNITPHDPTPELHHGCRAANIRQKPACMCRVAFAGQLSYEVVVFPALVLGTGTKRRDMHETVRIQTKLQTRQSPGPRRRCWDLQDGDRGPEIPGVPGSKFGYRPLLARREKAFLARCLSLISTSCK